MLFVCLENKYQAIYCGMIYSNHKSETNAHQEQNGKCLWWNESVYL